MDNVYVNELESLIHVARTNKKIDAKSKEKYKVIWNKLIEQEGFNDITERYMYNGVSFCGAGHYYEYLRRHDFNEKELATRLKNMTRRADAFTIFKFLINLLARALNSGNKEFIIGKVFQLLPSVSYNKENNLWANAHKNMVKYFLRFLGNNIQYPDLRNIKVSEVEFKAFHRIIIEILEIIKKEEKLDKNLLKHIVDIEKWLSASSATAIEKDVHRDEKNPEEKKNAVGVQKAVGVKQEEHTDASKVKAEEKNVKCMSLADIISQLKWIDFQMDNDKKRIDKLKSINENQTVENASLQRALQMKETLIDGLKIKTENNRQTIENLNKTIEDKNIEITILEEDNKGQINKIKELETKLEESERISNMLRVEMGKSKKEAMERIAAKLRIEYADFKEAKDIPMSVDLGNNLLAQLDNIFSILGKEGINCK